jgi:hypothetical protein
MDKLHPLLSKLVDLADSVDMATMMAERGNNGALHAWLEEIRDDAADLAEATREACDEAEPKRERICAPD